MGLYEQLSDAGLGNLGIEALHAAAYASHERAEEALHLLGNILDDLRTRMNEVTRLQFRCRYAAERVRELQTIIATAEREYEAVLSGRAA